MGKRKLPTDDVLQHILIDGKTARVKGRGQVARYAHILPTTVITFHPPEAMQMTQTNRIRTAASMCGGAIAGSGTLMTATA